MLEALESDSFQVREKATKELIESDTSIETLAKVIDQTEEPETKYRLNLAIQGKIEATGWIKLSDEEILKRGKHSGIENTGKIIYLVKTNHEGSDVIGKYLIEWDGGNFPIGEAEIMLPNFQVWIGEGTWKKWDPKSKNMIPMGRTNGAKNIYAVRAQHENGTHPGTLIEGETKARISWGGKVILLDEFEILESE